MKYKKLSDAIGVVEDWQANNPELVPEDVAKALDRMTAELYRFIEEQNQGEQPTAASLAFVSKCFDMTGG